MSWRGYFGLFILVIALMSVLSPAVLNSAVLGVDQEAAKLGLVTPADADEKAYQAALKKRLGTKGDKVDPMLVLKGDLVAKDGTAERLYSCADEQGMAVEEGPCSGYSTQRTTEGSERLPMDGGAANNVTRTATGSSTSTATGTSSSTTSSGSTSTTSP